MEAVQACGGAARWDRLRHTTTHRALQRAVAAGTVLRPAAGLYVLPGCAPDLLAATAARGVRSCHTAAAAWGLDLLDAPGAPYVTAARGSTATWRSTVVHRRSVRDLDGCTDPLTTFFDCLTCLPRRVALVPVDSALRRGLVSLEDLQLRAEELNRNDPRRHLVALADPGSGSALETVGRLDLLDEGYDLRTQQVREPAGRVDILIEEWLVVELDGWAFHSGPAQFAEDRRRDAELTARGFVVLRFTFEQVLRQREWWLGLVRATYRRGPQGRR